MSERVDKLRSLVKELEAELATLETVDAESQQALAATLQELHIALSSRVGAESLASETVVERLRDAEDNFQVSHPTISGLVVRMIDALGQLGI
ncbi:MAG: DUF4404 family protein [Pirellulaceae bacterium]